MQLHSQIEHDTKQLSKYNDVVSGLKLISAVDIPISHITLSFQLGYVCHVVKFEISNSHLR